MKYNKTLVTNEEITAAGGTISIDIDRHREVVRLFSTGTVVLAASWNVTYTGTPVKNAVVQIDYVGNTALTTVSGKDITIFGRTLTALEAKQNLIFLCLYNGSAWEVFVIPSQANAPRSTVALNTITLLAAGGSKTLDPLVDGDVQVIVGSATLTSSYTIGGILAPAPDGRTSFVVIYKATMLPTAGETVTIFGVTLTADQMLAGNSMMVAYYDITGSAWIGVMVHSDVLLTDLMLHRGYIITGQVGDVAGEMALGDAEFALGDGTDVNAVAMSGDATMDNTGLITINADAVVTSKILDSSVEPSKVTYTYASNLLDGVMCSKTLFGANVLVLCDGNVNNLFAVKEGDVILGCRISITAPAGTACTVDIGYDSDFSGGIADTDGIIVDADLNDATKLYTTEDPARTFTGTPFNSGALFANADSYITIKTDADISATALFANITLYYLSK